MSAQLPESALRSLKESVQEHSDELLAIANRVKMMKVRAATSHTDGKKSDGLPDPYKDPDGWRAAMNSRMAKQRIGL